MRTAKILLGTLVLVHSTLREAPQCKHEVMVADDESLKHDYSVSIPHCSLAPNYSLLKHCL